MDTLTPSDLFSPSKALAQRAQAQDWLQIETWLSYKYSGRPIPSFERNDSTLRVLRELAAANERADEERAVAERLEREALRELDEDAATNPRTALLSHLSTSLPAPGTIALHSLASTSTALNTPTSDPTTLSHTLISHTLTSQTLESQITHIQTLQRYLEKQHTILRTHLAELQTNTAFRTPGDLPRQTTEQVRQTKVLRGKIREFEDKVGGLANLAQQQRRSGSTSTSSSARTRESSGMLSAEAMEAMLEKQKELDVLRERVEELESQVKEFAGLPADRESARREVGKLEVELDAVRRRRDGLFEGLVAR